VFIFVYRLKIIKTRPFILKKSNFTWLHRYTGAYKFDTLVIISERLKISKRNLAHY